MCMIKQFARTWVSAVLLVCTVSAAIADTEVKQRSHPNLTVTIDDIRAIRSEIDQVPQARARAQQLIEKIDQLIAKPLDVPVPKDAGGGYTHEQHKRNYQTLYETGLLYQITQEQRFLEYGRAMLLAYANLYPTIDLHPKPKEQSPGRLFWQSLNEAVWLVHTIQAYDMLATGLKADDRRVIERDLLRPAAKFLSAGQPATFNKIHNHGTWAAAAVGMTGYTLGDDQLVQQALFGLDTSGKAGFLKQIDHLFSPDGYYAEGPYYQRYALMPFVLFAKAIDVNEPERNIFAYRDDVLLKAIRTTVQLSYNKLFFGINDAIKDKGIDTIELVHGIAIAYDVTKDPTLLSVAERQNQTLLTGYGFATAKALNDGLAKPFEFKSKQFLDGQNGDQGALAIFRSGIEKGHQALVMKNTSQGLGHGHFDKLHWLYFDNGNEIISDYGAARFLNIEAKYGGHYLPENNKWAKQTIAHNTVVVDEQSHFDGKWRVGQKSAPVVTFFSAADDVKITSARIDDAYADTALSRTMAMINHESLEYPLVVDHFNVKSKKQRQFDLPLHYQGQLISHNLELAPQTQKWLPLGDDNGYQFLWDRARGALATPLAQVTWLNDGRFYTYSTLGAKNEQMIFAQLGANDPNFNLKNGSALIHRVPYAAEKNFVSVLEQHGEYNGRAEYTVNAKSRVKAISYSQQKHINIIEIELVSDDAITVVFTEQGNDESMHSINHKDNTINWSGHFTVIKD